MVRRWLREGWHRIDSKSGRSVETPDRLFLCASVMRRMQTASRIGLLHRRETTCGMGSIARSTSMGRNEIQEPQKDEGDVAVAEEEKEEDIKTRLAKVISVEVGDAGVLRKTVSVSVPRESINTEFDKEFKDLIKEAIVPGFRRGRAPRRLVEKRFGGEVGAQVQTRLVSNAYLAAIEKEDLKVLGDPMVWVKPKKEGSTEVNERLMDMPTALQQLRLPEDGPLQFKCEVEVKPEFTVPNLEQIKVEKPELSISDEDVTEQTKRIRARRGNWA